MREGGRNEEEGRKEGEAWRMRRGRQGGTEKEKRERTGREGDKEV